jgi:glutaredoxin-like YruB-family protein
MQSILSLKDFLEILETNKRVALFFYNPESDSSRCAFRSVTEATYQSNQTTVFVVDVSQVRDLHPHYEVTTVPTLLLFVDHQLVNVVKGCQDSDYLKAIIRNELPVAGINEGTNKAPQVTVYSTPTCSWCNTLKTWLRNNNINFRDVDISKDEKVASDLVRRSGQQGVPQTDINGEIVVGFDQVRLKQLLQIN